MQRDPSVFLQDILEWRKMAGMRDMMIHGYFSINYRIVWDVVRNKIPKLKQHVEQLLNES